MVSAQDTAEPVRSTTTKLVAAGFSGRAVGAGLKAVGGIETLDQAMEAYQAGAARFGTTATTVILDAWKTQLAALQQGPAPVS